MLLESEKVPQDIVRIAKDCCWPEPAGRPNFTAISKALAKVASEDPADTRPLVRVKNGKIATVRTAGAATSGAGPTDKFSSTYREKFRSRSTNKPAEASPLVAPLAEQVASHLQEGGSDRTNKGSEPSSSNDSSARKFIDTFNATMLATFTPGKAAEPKPAPQPDSEAIAAAEAAAAAQAKAAQQAKTAANARAAAQNTAQQVTKRMAELEQLKLMGLLTDDEFEAKKVAIRAE